MSGGRRTVGLVNVAEQHWRAWLDRRGDDYATDEERRARVATIVTEVKW
jgi:hypothetical protein